MADNNINQITLEMLHSRMTNSIKTLDKSDASAQWTAICENAMFMLSNYDKLTTDAKKCADGVVELLAKQIEDITIQLPDSSTTRKLKRLARGSKGRRIHIPSCMQALMKPVDSPSDLCNRTKVILGRYLQDAADFYQDIAENALSGPAQFSQLSLFGMCIEELLIAFHLCERSYAQQVFAHLRTIEESLDLIALFSKYPEDATIWTSDEDSKKIWGKLKPSKVRTKLGDSTSSGLFYHVFSDLGTHPTFNMMRMKCRVSRETMEGTRPRITVSFGGIPNTKEAFFAHIFIILSLLRLLGLMVSMFTRYLNMEEAQDVLIGLTADFKNLLADCLVKHKGEETLKKFHADMDQLLEEYKDAFHKVEN